MLWELQDLEWLDCKRMRNEGGWADMDMDMVMVMDMDMDMGG